MSNDTDDDTCCMVCMDPLDEVDQRVNPCSCASKLCAWCWEEELDFDERCPFCNDACDAKNLFVPLKRLEEKAQKDSRSHCGLLSKVRVIQRNRVHVVGLSSSKAKEQNLNGPSHFGQYGEVTQVFVDTAKRLTQQESATVNVDITFHSFEEASRAIQCVNGIWLDGRRLRAYFGTNRYCPFFLSGSPCTSINCALLHSMADEADHYTREQMLQRRKEFECIGNQPMPNSCASFSQGWSVLEDYSNEAPEVDIKAAGSNEEMGLVAALDSSPICRLIEDEEGDLGLVGGHILPPSPTLDVDSFIAELSTGVIEHAESDPPPIQCDRTSVAAEAPGMDPNRVGTPTHNLHSFIALAAPPKVVVPETPNLASSMENADLDVNSIKAPLSSDGSSSGSSPTEDTLLDTSAQSSASSGFGHHQRHNGGHARHVRRQSRFSFAHNNDPAPLVLDSEGLDVDISGSVFFDAFDGSSSPAMEANDATKSKQPSSASSSEGLGSSSGKPRALVTPGAGANPEMQDKARAAIAAAAASAAQSSPSASPNKPLPTVSRGFPLSASVSGVTFTKNTESKALGVGSVADPLQLLPGLIPPPSRAMVFPIVPSGLPPDGLLLPAPAGPIPNLSTMKAASASVPPSTGMVPGIIPSHVTPFSGAKNGGWGKGAASAMGFLQAEEGAGSMYMAAWDAGSYDMAYDFSASLPMPSPSLQYLNAFGGPPLTQQYPFAQQMPRTQAPYLAPSPGFLPQPSPFPGPVAPASTSQLPGTNGALSRQSPHQSSSQTPSGSQPSRRTGQDFAPSYTFTTAGKQSAQYRP